jgi:hypothetical protein
MIPFNRTLPYETIQADIYVHECPFCSANHVLLPVKRKELKEIHEGRKKLLVFPCCYNKLTLVDADADYLLADRPIISFPHNLLTDQKEPRRLLCRGAPFLWGYVKTALTAIISFRLLLISPSWLPAHPHVSPPTALDWRGSCPRP